jgi:hypothetical protein
VRLLNNDNGQTDFTIAFTFSLKAAPQNRLGEDALKSYHPVAE